MAVSVSNTGIRNEKPSRKRAPVRIIAGQSMANHITLTPAPASRPRSGRDEIQNLTELFALHAEDGHGRSGGRDEHVHITAGPLEGDF